MVTSCHLENCTHLEEESTGRDVDRETSCGRDLGLNVRCKEASVAFLISSAARSASSRLPTTCW